MMNKIIANLRNLDEIDAVLLALAGLSIGALVGAAKERIVKKFSWLFAIIGVVSSVYILLKVFEKDTIEYDKITPIKYEG